MEQKEFKPYVPEKTDMKELTFKAVFIGVLLAVLLGSANAYVGLRAGMTIAATFPAAVVAMAFLRVFKGTVLEENIARTTASVGEALVAGAIFTFPGFILAGVWDNIHIWESIMIMMIGGVLGVMFVIVLRRTLVNSPELPFPESVACSEIVKAGQKGSTGANFVFGAAAFGAFIELFKNSKSFQWITEYKEFFYRFNPSQIQFLDGDGNRIGNAFRHEGGMYYTSPAANSAFLGVGYIIGTRLSSITFSGGVFGWLMLIPLLLFINNSLGSIFTTNPDTSWTDIGHAVWYFQVRPIAVGAMIVGAVFALWNMRKNLTEGIGKAIRDMRSLKAGGEVESRIEHDLPFNKTMMFTAFLSIPMALLYYY
ncbi:MAG: oligopeptide transporter, OPT family, partial [bacterium]|nr:oligopeptide transporter, OPT family [bacterium]